MKFSALILVLSALPDTINCLPELIKTLIGYKDPIYDEGVSEC